MINQIRKYEKVHIDLVKKFNSRLRLKNLSVRFPESNSSCWLPEGNDTHIFQEYFLAFSDNEVRGGYILKYQNFLINQKILSIADYQMPLSEGIINPKYAFIGISLTLDALKRSPKLFAMGMGGFSEKLPKLLKSMKWKLCKIPFHFLVLNPNKFLLNIAFLRRNLLTKLVFNTLAYLKIGSIIIKLLFFLRKRKFNFSNLKINEFEKFDNAFDKLWNKEKIKYKFIAVRDSQTLNKLYSDSKFAKIIVCENDDLIGWVVLLNTQMKKHKQFGSMRVGSIVDCFADPKNATKILYSATEYLKSCKVDIIVANHSHLVWNKSFQDIGYLQGPSNFLFAASNALANEIEPFKENCKKLFLMRGDGDGPINL